MVAFLPFPTRLIADALHHEGSERVFVTMYGLVLLAIRILGFALDAYARPEHLYSPSAAGEEQQDELRELLPALGGYVIAIVIGLALPGVAVAAYCAVALYMVLSGGSHDTRSVPIVPVGERPATGLICSGRNCAQTRTAGWLPCSALGPRARCSCAG